LRVPARKVLVTSKKGEKKDWLFRLQGGKGRGIRGEKFHHENTTMWLNEVWMGKPGVHVLCSLGGKKEGAVRCEGKLLIAGRRGSAHR